MSVMVSLASDVTAAVLVERKIAKKSFGNLILLFMQNLSYILLLFWHQHGCLIT